MAHPRDFIDPVTGSWKCIRCGACCEQIPVHLELVELGFDRGDGVCKNLMPDRSCGIYKDRPEICRVRPDHYKNPMDLARMCAFVNHLGPVSKERWEMTLSGHLDEGARTAIKKADDAEGV